MPFLVSARNRRDREWDMTIYEDDGTTEVVLASDDVVRLKIGTNDEEPPLDLSSLDPDEITFTVGTGDCVVYLTAAQVAVLGAGVFDCEVNVYDESENKFKQAEYGAFTVHPTQLGETGGEQSSSSGGSSESSSSGGSSESSSSSF
jgi:hypothetical protein